MSSVNSVENSPFLSDVPERMPKTELDKDDFLKLLMTQMQYQDPLNPMDNNQYIAQMAQLSTLEQMTNLTQAFSTTQALGLMGKNVTANTLDEIGNTVEIKGLVQSVKISGSSILLSVDGKEFKLSDITEVRDSASEAAANEAGGSTDGNDSEVTENNGGED